MKRGRIDGQVSKEEYEKSNLDVDSPGSFLRATPNTLASRRILVPKTSSKKKEFVKHMKVLNQSFFDWFGTCVRADPNQFMNDAVQDYIDYALQLEDRYLRSYGEVMTFGSGDCGQLAHGVEKDDDLMVRFPRVVYSLREKKVVGIACGGLHNAVFTEDGLVYTWGCADDGSLGREGDENVPLLLDSLKNETIIGVACGDGQTLAVSTAGEVWAWGSYKDKEGKKWFNSSDKTNIQKQQNEPLKIEGFHAGCEIVEVTCGSSFNVARSADGSVYSWGIGECGELGRETRPLKGADGNYDKEAIFKDHLTPGKMYIATLSGLKKEAQVPKAIGCGAYHTLIVIGSSVYACGLNNYGQLGIGGTESKHFLTSIDFFEGRGVVSVKGGMHHSLVLTSSGVMFSFGRADSGQHFTMPSDGQLGIQDKVSSAAGDFADSPQEVILPEMSNGTPSLVVQIACGANHNLAVLRNEQEMYSWGYGDMLALGHGKERDELTPKRLNLQKSLVGGGAVERIVQVDGGGQHSAIIAVIKSA